MPKTASISARIDPDLKQEAEAIFSELELTASQAIALFYKQVINKQGIPFELIVQSAGNGANGHINNRTEARAPTYEELVVEPGPESPIYHGPEHEAILKEQEAYEAMHSELWALYPNQYVAVYQGEVVDRDTDELALWNRRIEKYPDKTVLVTQIEEEPIKTFHMRSPRLIK